MIDTVVQESWSRILDRLRVEIGEKFFRMWFERSRVLGLKRGVLVVGVPNLFIREWVEEHYEPMLVKVAEEELGLQVRIAVKVDPDLFREMRRETEQMEEVADASGEAAEGKSLDSFVITAGNRKVVQAIRHVAAGRRPPMNPLVIHGGEGTGKTHLAAALTRLFPRGTSFYRLTGEDFSRRFAWNLKTRRIAQFREQVTGADVVIMDDAEMLAGKPATQREMSGLVQAVQARGGQLVFMLDAHPDRIPDLDPGLRSILLSGMLLEIGAPRPEETIRILERVLATARRRIPGSMIRLVAERIGGSVKRLDRLIRKAYAFSALTGEAVDEAFLDEHLEELAGPADPHQRRLETILSLVEEHFDVTRDALLSKRKTKALSIPRGVVVVLLRENVGLTYKEIGRQLGARSHTSVYLMYQKYGEAIRADATLADLVGEAGRRLVTAG